MVVVLAAWMSATCAAAAWLACSPVASATTVAEPAPFSLRYGPETLETAVIYPSLTADSPIVVLVHGGGFKSYAGTPESGPAKSLQAAGFAVFDANYSNDVGGAFPVQPNDIIAAANAARAAAPSYNGDASRVTLLGGSSGGLLVSLAAEDLDNAGTPVQHVITLSAPFYFPTLLGHWASLGNNTGRVHLDEDYRALNCSAVTCTLVTEQTWSPFGNVNANTRTTSWLLFNGDAERMPVQQPEYMAHDLATWGVQRTLDIFPDIAHAFSYFPVVKSQIVAFASH
jgi:acetyl esterase/lipase